MYGLEHGSLRYLFFADVISRTISSLRDIHNNWKDADLTIINFMSQLSSLRAALNKIAEWIASDLADVPQHHLLVIDLESAITCCQILIHAMDDQISRLTFDEDESLDVESRVRVVFSTKLKDFHGSIQGQVSALTLLLTACNR